MFNFPLPSHQYWKEKMKKPQPEPFVVLLLSCFMNYSFLFGNLPSTHLSFLLSSPFYGRDWTIEGSGILLFRPFMFFVPSFSLGEKGNAEREREKEEEREVLIKVEECLFNWLWKELTQSQCERVGQKKRGATFHTYLNSSLFLSSFLSLSLSLSLFQSPWT